MCMGEHTMTGAPSQHSRLSGFRRHKTSAAAGFTLIELLIVIVVLGVLAGTVIFALDGVNSSAAVASCNSDAKSVETAVAAYEAQVGTAPPDIGALAPTYLHTVPSSSNPNYLITLSSGAVMVQAPPSVTPAVPYDGNSGACSGAGGGGEDQVAIGSTTTTVGNNAIQSPSTTSTTAAPTTTTTTVPPTTTTTTTTPVSNGVTAVPSTQTYNGYGGQDILTVSNSKSITSMTITIVVAPTTGVGPGTGYTSFPGGAGNTSYGMTSTYTVISGHSIPAGSPSGSFAAQYTGTGSARVQTGDTWQVVSTSNGVTSTISGHF
jgi:general secretion pathway protein G